MNGYLDYYNVEIELKDVYYVTPPVKIAKVHEKLGLSKKWGNFVRTTHSISEDAFNILTGQI